MLENVLSLIPGYAFYRGIGALEAAAVNKQPLSASDLFDPDKGVLYPLLMLWLDTLLFCLVIWLMDTRQCTRQPKHVPG